MCRNHSVHSAVMGSGKVAPQMARNRQLCDSIAHSTPAQSIRLNDGWHEQGSRLGGRLGGRLGARLGGSSQESGCQGRIHGRD